MKKVLFVILLFSIINVYAIEKIKYTNAPSGLRLRESPNTESKVILTIPYNEKVAILDEDDKSVTFENISGKWTKIRYNKNEGWVFGGFLTDNFNLRVTENNSNDSWEIINTEHFTEDIKSDDGKTVMWKIERCTVSFKNGKKYVLPLERAKPIAVLKGSDNSFFLLAEGADCTECDENIGLRFYELGGTKLKKSENRHAYPGRLYYYLETNKLIEETQTFYGQCTADKSDVVIWFIKYLGDNSKWHNVNGIVRISKAGDILEKIETKDISLTSVLKAVKEGRCKELPGIDCTSEP